MFLEGEKEENFFLHISKFLQNWDQEYIMLKNAFLLMTWAKSYRKYIIGHRKYINFCIFLK